jgi:taurine-pyruvate aminotransferase
MADTSALKPAIVRQLDDPMFGMTQQELIELAKRHTWFPNGHDQSAWEGPATISVSQSSDGYTDVHGNTYIEANSAFAGGTLGRNNRYIIGAVVAELERNALVLTGSGSSPVQILLSMEIAARTPGSLNRVLYGLSGSDANEMAFKVARQYWKIRGQGSKFKFISEYGSYHGAHFGASAASGYAHRRLPFEPLPNGFLHVDPPHFYDTAPNLTPSECASRAVDALRRTIEFEGPSSIAAWIGNLVITSLGPYPVPAEYPRQIRELCNEYGILMIVDEVITGWGRLGAWTASEHYGVVPDMMTLAKGLSALYQPLSALVVRDEVADLFTGTDCFEHVLTVSGNSPACAAGLATIRYLEEHRILERVREKHPWLRSQLQALEERHACVGRTYCVGLEGGMELVRDKSGATPTRFTDLKAVSRLIREVGLSHGVVLTSMGRQMIIAPALTATDHELERIIYAIDQALTQVDSHFCMA